MKKMTLKRIESWSLEYIFTRFSAKLWQQKKLSFEFFVIKQITLCNVLSYGNVIFGFFPHRNRSSNVDEKPRYNQSLFQDMTHDLLIVPPNQL